MSETKVYTLEEVSKHKTGRDCWVVIHNKVYDVTKFLDEVTSHKYPYVIYHFLFQLSFNGINLV